MENKLVCRKCNGPHLTIKCGKEKEPNKIESQIKVDTYKSYEKPRTYDEKPRLYRGRGYKCKILNLPSDITENELMELLYEWGHLISVHVKCYNEYSIAFIEFKYEDEIDYLVKALDKTPFDRCIINVEKLIETN
jgi:hypothetical protein